MEIWMLDASLGAIAPLGMVKEVRWKRNRMGTGAVTVRCLSVDSDVLARGRYLYRTDTREGAILASFQDAEGEVVLCGYELGYILSLRRLKNPMAASERADLALLGALRAEYAGEGVFRALAVKESEIERVIPFAGSEAGVDLSELARLHLLEAGGRIRLRLSGDEIGCYLEQARDRSGENGFFGQIVERHPGLNKDRLEAVRALVTGVDAQGGELLVCVEEDAADHCFYSELLVDGGAVKRRWRGEDGQMIERSEEEYRSMLALLGREALRERKNGRQIEMLLSRDTDRERLAEAIGDFVRVSDRTRSISLMGDLIESEERYAAGVDQIWVTLSRNAEM